MDQYNENLENEETPSNLGPQIQDEELIKKLQEIDGLIFLLAVVKFLLFWMIGWYSQIMFWADVIFIFLYIVCGMVLPDGYQYDSQKQTSYTNYIQVAFRGCFKLIYFWPIMLIKTYYIHPEFFSMKEEFFWIGPGLQLIPFTIVWLLATQMYFKLSKE